MPSTQTYWQLAPPVPPLVLLGLLAGLLVAALLVAWWLGHVNPVARRFSLTMLRGLTLLLAIGVLFNPIRVKQEPGPVERPEMFYLLDASASMAIGDPRSRWEEAAARIQAANQIAVDSPAVVKPFRFGQRLLAIEPQDFARQLANTVDAKTRITPASINSATSKSPGASGHSLGPTDGDTRLMTALRQISSRFGRLPPMGIVVFSDGRAQEEGGLEELAQQFARLKVPIHVMPVGDASKGGDIAVAAVVVPPRARKFTEVEAQVFLRSFGYDGQRCELQLVELDNQRRPGRTVASLPVTLQSGFQSISLGFRTEVSMRRLRVIANPLVGEVTKSNNQVDTEMAIDRTKIRILYIEGNSNLLTLRRPNQPAQRGAFSDFKQALIEDEDIECVVLAAMRGSRQLVRVSDNPAIDGVRGFPATMAELAAFDALVLSDVDRETLTDQQLEWIERWIGQRGGGICMAGGPRSFASGNWGGSALAAMLPVELSADRQDWRAGESLQVVPRLPPAPHPLWNLLADDTQSRQAAAAIPAIGAFNLWKGARPALSTIVATGRTATEDALPAIVVGRYGRGRSAALAFPLTPPLAEDLVQKWGVSDNRHFAKFARNLAYWLTESSAIGRRRLVASTDKRFYRPGDAISVLATTYDESAAASRSYRVVAMAEPHVGAGQPEPETAPLRWPEGLSRTSGESGPMMVWGEEFELAAGGEPTPAYHAKLPIAEILSSGMASQSLRLELTAYEGQTQVDSTSLDVQILHDPFEQQNPFPNHELLTRLATASGGKVLQTAEQLAELLDSAPTSIAPPVVRRAPLWSNALVLLILLGLLTVEWFWRRMLGLA